MSQEIDNFDKMDKIKSDDLLKKELKKTIFCILILVT